MANQLLNSLKESFLNRELVSNKKPKYDDDVIECMQFGICDSHPHSIKEVPYYFHF